MFKILLSLGLLAYRYLKKKGQTEVDLRVRIDFIYHGIILEMEVSLSQCPHSLFQMRDLFACIIAAWNQKPSIL